MTPREAIIAAARSLPPPRRPKHYLRSVSTVDGYPRYLGLYCGCGALFGLILPPRRPPRKAALNQLVAFAQKRLRAHSRHPKRRFIIAPFGTPDVPRS